MASPDSSTTAAAEKPPQTPQKQKLQGNGGIGNVSPCPSASTSGQSFYDSTPATPPSGLVHRNGTTLAERRGKLINPLADSLLLDHPIYAFGHGSPRRHVNFVSSRAQDRGNDSDNEDEHDHYNEMDTKTPKAKHVNDMSSANSTSPNVDTGSTFESDDDNDLTRRGLPSACVFIANLASTRTDDELQKSLQSWFGKIGRVYVKIRRDEKGNPYSFCQFENNEDAKKAIREGRGQIIDGSGRRIRCEPAKVNRTLLLAKLDNGIFEENEAKKVVGSFGKIESLEFINGKYAAARGIRNGCFVRFMYRQDAVDCHQYFRSHNTWTVEWANNVPGPKPTASPGNVNLSVDPYSIFVGQLNADNVNKEALYERFRKYGDITDLNLVIKPGKFGLGRNAFAFIKYDDHLSATRAIDQENNCPFLGRIIHVQRREFHSHKVNNGQQSQSQSPCEEGQTRHGNSRMVSKDVITNGRSMNMPVSQLAHPFSVNVQEMADLTARVLAMNYGPGTSFTINPGQSGLAGRTMNYPGDPFIQLQQNSMVQPQVLYPYYPSYYYSSHAPGASTPSGRNVNANSARESNKDRFNIPYSNGIGYYVPRAEGIHCGPANPEMLHPSFSANMGSGLYDTLYNPYGAAMGHGHNSDKANAEQRFGYGSEHYDSQDNTAAAGTQVTASGHGHGRNQH